MGEEIEQCFRVLVSTDGSSVFVETALAEEVILFERGKASILKKGEVVKPQLLTYSTSILAYGIVGVVSTPTDDFLAIITDCELVGKLPGGEVFRITGMEFISIKRHEKKESSMSNQKQKKKDTFHYIVGLKKLFCKQGTTFFAMGYDLTTPLGMQERCNSSDSNDGHISMNFAWNRVMADVFCKICSPLPMSFLVPVIRGHFDCKKIGMTREGESVWLALLSRTSSVRPGGSVHGIDDKGYCASYVETEQICFSNSRKTSYLQVRASVPVFWDRSEGYHSERAPRVKLSRGFEATAPAFENHFRKLRDSYKQVLVVNLLGTKGDEEILTEAFSSHLINIYKNLKVDHITFDFNRHCKGGKFDQISNLTDLIENSPSFSEYLSFFVDKGTAASASGKPLYQKGVIRTSCLDCLNRTNLVQSAVGTKVLHGQLNALGVDDTQTRLKALEVSKDFCNESGMCIGLCFGGSKPIIAEFNKEGKATVATRVDWTMKSLRLKSSSKANKREEFGNLVLQNELLLTNRPSLNKVDDIVERYLLEQMPNYVEWKKLRIYLGTWNVNRGNYSGVVPLLDTMKYRAGESPIDMYIVGLQDLKYDTIVERDQLNSFLDRKDNYNLIQRAISSEYALLLTEQIASVCIYVYVRNSLLANITDVRIDSCKVGKNHWSSNKGAVGVRMKMFDSSFCFISAYLTTGKVNLSSRNEDYEEILKAMNFGKFGTVLDHDSIFWMGDLNYRLDMSVKDTQVLMNKRDWAGLLEHDQLKKMQSAGTVFAGFKEQKINFAPTSKYQPFTDNYELGERPPAYTDRILYNSGDTEPISYCRAELAQSNHKPVMAQFVVNVKRFDSVKRGGVVKDALEKASFQSTAQKFGKLYKMKQSKEGDAQKDSDTGSVLSNNSKATFPFLGLPPTVQKYTGMEEVGTKFIKRTATKTVRSHSMTEGLKPNGSPSLDQAKENSMQNDLSYLGSPLTAEDCVKLDLDFFKNCIDAIEFRNLNKEGIYRVAGSTKAANAFLANYVENSNSIDWYDSEAYGTHLLTTVMKRALKVLPHPLLTFAMYDDWISLAKFEEEAEEKLQFAKNKLLSLPVKNQALLKILFLHLNRVSSMSNINLMTGKSLGTVFGPTLLRPLEETIDVLKNLEYRNAIVEFFIMNAPLIFEKRETLGEKIPKAESVEVIKQKYHDEDIDLSFYENCIEAIEQRGLDVKGIYRITSQASHAASLLDLHVSHSHLVDWNDKDRWKTETLTTALTKRLKSLPEPLLTFSLYDTWVEISAIPENLLQKKLDCTRDAILKLSRTRQHVLQLVTKHLQRVSDDCHQNQMTTMNLGIVFGPTLLSPKIENAQSFGDIDLRNGMITFLIENADSLFQ
eukprot:Nk52_evm58s207 gene=Nk52_evmTU58s207